MDPIIWDGNPETLTQFGRFTNSEITPTIDSWGTLIIYTPDSIKRASIGDSLSQENDGSVKIIHRSEQE